jgi:hypothetical protein
MAARFPGEERAWAVKAVASNFPGPVGRGSEMVRVLNFTPSGGRWSAPVCFYHTEVAAGLNCGIPIGYLIYAKP